MEHEQTLIKLWSSQTRRCGTARAKRSGALPQVSVLIIVYHLPELGGAMVAPGLAWS